MAEVSYLVALPFVAADDGLAAGEPTECFNPVRSSFARKRCLANRDMWEP